MLPPEQEYFLETAIAELAAARACLSQNRIARAQEHIREAKYWSFKVPAEFTQGGFANNLYELEKLAFRRY